jgi:hypothetical protein
MPDSFLVQIDFDRSARRLIGSDNTGLSSELAGFDFNFLAALHGCISSV